MRSFTIYSLFVTATWANTRHPRLNHHVRKRSLQGTTPYGNFDDQEHDYILSITPPAMHHDIPQSSTKTTSSKKSSSSKKSKGKGSKGKGSKDSSSSKSKGKGKGKKKSKKSSSKATSSPAPTLSPVVEETAPTQTPALATQVPATTVAPAAPPTTDAPTSRPTMETLQAPTSSPTPLDPASTNAPAPVDDTSTSVPSVSDTDSTNAPTPADDSSTSAPTSLDTSLSSVPTAAIVSSTDLPTASDESRTSAPTASTNPPTSAAEAPTAVPVALPTGDFETTLNLDQVPPQFHGVFRNAAAKWDSIIVGDLEDYPIFEEDRTNPELLCDGNSLPEIVDDVFICARLPNIDGPNSILGSAGPIFGRVGDFVQTAVGYMEFDLADVEMLETQGRLDGLIVSTIPCLIY